MNSQTVGSQPLGQLLPPPLPYPALSTTCLATRGRGKEREKRKKREKGREREEGRERERREGATEGGREGGTEGGREGERERVQGGREEGKSTYQNCHCMCIYYLRCMLSTLNLEKDQQLVVMGGVQFRDS